MPQIPIKETVFKGLALSGGVALGRVCRFNQDRHSNLEIYKVHATGIEGEIARVRQAAKLVSERLENIRREAAKTIGPAEAEIFAAQKMLATDEMLRARVEETIRQNKQNAEAAILSVLNEYEDRMRQIDDVYIQDRATDFGEIKRRFLDALRNMNPEFQCSDEEHCQRGRNRIIVTQELTPGLTMEIDTAHTLGFVTEHGGVNSHAAILARALGIPAVSGIEDAHAIMLCGTELLVNGDTGEVVVWPGEDTIARLRETPGTLIKAPGPVPPVDGFRVMANISRASEAAEAAEMLAEGIGLYRTEFEFMAAGRFLNEDEQYEIYASVVRAMNGKPATFRLFDAGGDKPLRFLNIPKEDNPALGWRGSRLLADKKDLFKTQARALARASKHGPVNVLYPMIADADQFAGMKAVFLSAADGLDTGEMKHGVMFEVPSACVEPAPLLDAADFGSIGTNDLIQYLFAVDRNNELVARHYSMDKPVLWSVIGIIVRAARKSGKPLSVCGEIAGHPKYVLQLMDAGIDTVSVSARLIPGVRAAAGTRTRSALKGTTAE